MQRPTLSTVLALVVLVLVVGLVAGLVMTAVSSARLQASVVCRTRMHQYQEAVNWLPVILEDCTVDILGDGSVRVPLEDYLQMERTDWWVNRAARVMVDQHNSGDPMPMEWCLP